MSRLRVASFICLVLMSVLWFWLGEEGRKPFAATLSHQKGRVFVDGEAARLGMTIGPGRKLCVHQGGWARLTFPDGSTQFLFARPQHGGPLVYEFKEGPGRGQVRTMVCNLATGALDFFVPKRRHRRFHFRFRAEHTLTAVRGTSGLIVSMPAGDRVELRTGLVEILHRRSGRSMMLSAGQMVEAGPRGFARPAPLVRRADKVGLFEGEGSLSSTPADDGVSATAPEGRTAEGSEPETVKEEAEETVPQPSTGKRLDNSKSGDLDRPFLDSAR